MLTVDRSARGAAPADYSTAVVVGVIGDAAAEKCKSSAEDNQSADIFHRMFFRYVASFSQITSLLGVRPFTKPSGEMLAVFKVRNPAASPDLT